MSKQLQDAYIVAAPRSPIGKARLQAFPRATLSVSCKQKEARR